MKDALDNLVLPGFWMAARDEGGDNLSGTDGVELCDLSGQGRNSDSCQVLGGIDAAIVWAEEQKIQRQGE
jgi:hypothetical protein